MAPETQERLLARIQELQERLEEAEETLRALRAGEIDAIIASGPEGDRIYTLRGADEPYRVLVQGMSEGALTVNSQGLILFANQQFASIVGTPLERVIGSRVQDFSTSDDESTIAAMLTGEAGWKAEVRLIAAGGVLVPVYLSAENLVFDGVECLCLIVTDLTEQKKSEEIVAAEKLARSILEQAAEAVLVADPDGRIMRASRAAERLAGTSVLQREFDGLFRITLSSGRAYKFGDILAQAKRNQTIPDIETTGLSPTGRRMDLRLSAALLSGPGGRLLGCVVHLSDITDHKQRERQLRFQADILETTSEAVIALDPEQRVMLFNSGAERLYGVSRDEALGKRVTDLYRYVALDRSGDPAAQAALETQGIWSGENMHVRRDGARIFVHSTVNAIGPEHGGGTFAIIRDITESKKAEAVLRESEARERSRSAELLGIMEAVPAAVLIAHDSGCRNIEGNRMASKLLHETPDGKLWREMREGKDIPQQDLPLQMAALTGQPVHDYEFDLVGEDGQSLCWLGHAVPLFDEFGKTRGAIGAFVDITERKRAEERLQQTQKLESIGLLAGGIAHDFNNLLVGVIGNASLAQEMLPPESHAVGLLQGVIRTGEQLASLTRQMLAYAGKGRFFVESLDLSDLIPEMTRLVQPSIPKKITLQFELDRELPAIEADRGQVQQVFMNLVLNAAEAIGNNNGLISVRTGVQMVDQAYIRRHRDAAELSPGKYVYLQVRDTGCGMHPSTKSKIFDPFFTTKFTGRGLGLAAVSGVVRGHKGAIEVTSAPGKGSCFTVLLPSSASAILARKPAEPVHASNGTGTVLVVDDEAVVREMAQKVLMHHGFEVLLANSGLDAIDLLRRHAGQIALVLLDLSMPGISGEETLPELRKIQPDIKVLVSSGYNEAETMALFRGQRVSGFIQKPYTSASLTEKVTATVT